MIGRLKKESSRTEHIGHWWGTQGRFERRFSTFPVQVVTRALLPLPNPLVPAENRISTRTPPSSGLSLHKLGRIQAHETVAYFSVPWPQLSLTSPELLMLLSDVHLASASQKLELVDTGSRSSFAVCYMVYACTYPFAVALLADLASTSFCNSELHR